MAEDHASIRANFRGVRRTFGAAAAGGFLAAVAEIMRREGALGEKRIMERLSSSSESPGRTEIHSRTGFLRRTIGFRVESAKDAASLYLGTLRMGSGRSTLRYARIQEYGGTVRPVRARALTIPTEAAKTPAGVARFTAREVLGGHVPGFSRSFILSFPGFAGIFAERGAPGAKRRRVSRFARIASRLPSLGRRSSAATPYAGTPKPGPSRSRGSVATGRLKKADVVMLFLLVKSASIPARPYVGPERRLAFEAVRERIGPALTRVLTPRSGGG